MRILQINANYGFGSTGLIVRDIGASIEDSDTMEAYYAFQRSNAKLNNGYRIGNVLDWKLHAILYRFFGPQGFFSRISTYFFLKRIYRLKPDVVHLHNLHSNYINVPMLLRYLAKHDIATVITMHDCWWFTGLCYHYIDVDCNQFISGCKKCPKRYAVTPCRLWDCSRYMWEIKKTLLLSIPRLKIIGCSQWICNEARKGFLKSCDIDYIYNGVDTTIFSPHPTNFKDMNGLIGKTIIMGMANKWMILENRGVIEKLSKRDDFLLMIVGCSEEQKKLLVKIARNAYPIGFIHDREELAKLYNTADVFVNLTLADTLPTVNMESICCGTPVVTWDSSGSPELVHEGMGYVVKQGDIDQLEICIDKVINEHLEVDVAKARKLYDNKENYKKYIQIYNDLRI